jgi:hypothetical protein
MNLKGCIVVMSTLRNGLAKMMNLKGCVVVMSTLRNGLEK